MAWGWAAWQPLSADKISEEGPCCQSPLSFQSDPLKEVRTWLALADHGGLEREAGLRRSVPSGPRFWRAYYDEVLCLCAQAGGELPVHRPHYWGYSETSGPDLVRSIALLEQNRLVEPLGTEVENFSYGPWNKSYRQTAAQKSSGNGSAGASYWTARPPGLWTKEASESS